MNWEDKPWWRQECLSCASYDYDIHGDDCLAGIDGCPHAAEDQTEASTGAEGNE